MRLVTKLALPALLTLPCCALAAAPVKISGLMQIDASFGKDFQQHRVSDIILRKIELGLDSQINERTAMHILLEHEDGDGGMSVTEGNINLDLTNGWYLMGGKIVVPFGIYETHMITDSLTKPLGEAHEDALLIGYGGNEGIYGSIFAFNGDTIETSTSLKGNDSAKHFGANAGYIFSSDDMTLDIGLDYTSSIGDADTLFESLSINTDTDGDTQTDTATLNDHVSGIACHAVFSNGPLSAIVEYLRADKFETGELAFNGQGAEPSAANIEAAYAFEWATVALAYQATDDALALGLPKTRILAGVSKDLFENTTLKVEYAKDEDYDSTDSDGSNNGTGRNASTVTFQLAVTF